MSAEETAWLAVFFLAAAAVISGSISGGFVVIGVGAAIIAIVKAVIHAPSPFRSLEEEYMRRITQSLDVENDE